MKRENDINREVKLQKLFYGSEQLFDVFTSAREGVTFRTKVDNNKPSRAHRVMAQGSVKLRSTGLATLTEFNMMKEYMEGYADVLDSIRRENTANGKPIIPVNDDIVYMLNHSLAYELT